MSRAALAILSTENLLNNLRVIKETSGNSRVMAMIKANAYGHGLRSTAKRICHHVDTLGVASIDEAVALREIGIKSSITLAEGVFEPDELLIASVNRFSVVFHEESQLQWLEGSSLPLPLRAWMKIDTGMGRLGFPVEKAVEVYKRLSRSSHLIQPVGVFSHFACADQASHPMNEIQKAAFFEVCKSLPDSHLIPKTFANSPAIFNFPETHLDLVRPGISLYGVSPFVGKTAQELGLKPVLTLQTRLIAVRQFAAGASVGYGSLFTCPESMPVGVVAMGYGDGYPRTARTGTPVLVGQKKCQLVGRVSMDMATIDLRNCPEAKVGDPVTLWGEGLPIEEVASFTANCPYDLLTGIQQRVKFHWTLET